MIYIRFKKRYNILYQKKKIQNQKNLILAGLE